MVRDAWSMSSAVSLYLVLLFGMAGAIAAGSIAMRVSGDLLIPVAFVGFVLGVAAYGGVQMLRTRRNIAKGASLQKQLHELKQQEIDLRYQEAKASGALDRWSKDI